MAEVPPQLKQYCAKPGQVLNPKGRPKGSRNKVADQFIADYLHVWKEKGMQCLYDLAADRPADFVKIGPQLIPKDFQLTISDDVTTFVIGASPALTTEEWQAEHSLGAPTEGSKAITSQSNGVGRVDDKDSVTVARRSDKA